MKKQARWETFCMNIQSKGNGIDGWGCSSPSWWSLSSPGQSRLDRHEWGVSISYTPNPWPWERARNPTPWYFGQGDWGGGRGPIPWYPGTGIPLWTERHTRLKILLLSMRAKRKQLSLSFLEQTLPYSSFPRKVKYNNVSYLNQINIF